MKKNISINISGIIFHIEEDGFEQLKEYLGSINKYFSTFDGSNEIIADIESRIAEIFLSKLNEGKQVITLEDVTNLIATMGSIQDFQAVEDDAQAFTDEKDEPGHDEPSPSEKPKKKLYRDKKRKLLGGVAAGIAHYFAVDPLWIRLIFIVLLFDFFVTSLVSFLAIIAYIVLWIVTPESDNLEEDKKLKKMYRNPQGRVIGGVAGGIASYFDIDITIVRLLFVLTALLGGTGIIAYLVLWIILPEAKSITDKVQMKGEAVTLENIDSNIKKTQESKDNPKEESVFVRVLLFPFRLIATILSGIAKALGPIASFLVDFIRVIVGIILTIIGLVLLFSILIIGATIMGLIAGSGMIHTSAFPIELLHNTMSPIGYISAIIVVGIPALTIMFLGISITSKTRIPNASVAWTMFALWILGIIGLSFTLPAVIYDFQSESDYTKTSYFDINASQIVLDINNIGNEELSTVRLKLRGYDGDEVKLVQDFSARGASTREALENAKNISYHVQRNDSILIFDSNIDFSKERKFRNQDLVMTLYIPYDQNFIMKHNFDDLIYYSFGYQGYRSADIIGNEWMFNPSGLECLTCTNYSTSNASRREKYEAIYKDVIRPDKNDVFYDFKGFDAIDISGPYTVKLVQGDEYKVVLNGAERYIAQTGITKISKTLRVTYNEKKVNIHRYNNKLEVKIVCPHLSDVRFSEAVKGDVSGFEEEELLVKLDGASEANMDMDIYYLEVKLSGASKLDLTGKGKELSARVTTASLLNSYNYQVENVKLKTSGAAKARVYASEDLTIEASLISDVKYRGGAKVTKVKSSAFSRVQED